MAQRDEKDTGSDCKIGVPAGAQRSGKGSPGDCRVFIGGSKVEHFDFSLLELNVFSITKSYSKTLETRMEQGNRGCKSDTDGSNL